MTEPIRPIGARGELPAVTPVQRRRPRDDDDDERQRREHQQPDRPREVPARHARDPERLIDVEA
jgi:hypothetical protein